ncbi:hypothetical protein [Pararhodobacter sp.]|uniref:hypothetical protein n=1 Tax=Pararhodobacter sp. TaxID=2127056 RepID=UPI002FE0502D|nr:GIY-YIG nuclease family protein [Pseudomonadota bacterium]
MNRQDRKAAVSAYREARPQAGIYAVHAGGLLWIGAAPRLDTVENRLRFVLGQGVHPDAALQAAAAAGYRFEILERLDPETEALSRPRVLKERFAHWLEATGGRAL